MFPVEFEPKPRHERKVILPHLWQSSLFSLAKTAHVIFYYRALDFSYQALGQGYEEALLKQAGGEQSKMADDELVAMDLSWGFSFCTDF